MSEPPVNPSPPDALREEISRANEVLARLEGGLPDAADEIRPLLRHAEALLAALADLSRSPLMSTFGDLDLDFDKDATGWREARDREKRQYRLGRSAVDPEGLGQEFFLREIAQEQLGRMWGTLSARLNRSGEAAIIDALSKANAGGYISEATRQLLRRGATESALFLPIRRANPRVSAPKSFQALQSTPTSTTKAVPIPPMATSSEPASVDILHRTPITLGVVLLIQGAVVGLTLLVAGFLWSQIGKTETALSNRIEKTEKALTATIEANKVEVSGLRNEVSGLRERIAGLEVTIKA